MSSAPVLVKENVLFLPGIKARSSIP
jgi:hypothetical protein